MLQPVINVLTLKSLKTYTGIHKQSWLLALPQFKIRCSKAKRKSIQDYTTLISEALSDNCFNSYPIFSLRWIHRNTDRKRQQKKFTDLKTIECFHSRGQHLCKFIETKENVCIRKEFNSHRIGLGHQHGRRFIVLGHQYGRRDVMWKHSITINFRLTVSRQQFKLKYCRKPWFNLFLIEKISFRISGVQSYDTLRAEAT